MKTILLHNPAKQDNVEAMADALVESMRYANSAVDYPDVSKAKPDDGVPAEWFHKAYAGITGAACAAHRLFTLKTEHFCIHWKYLLK